MNKELSNSLFSKFPLLKEEWDFEYNEELGLNPENLSYGSSKKAYWKCEYGHRYLATINNRTKGRGCSYCSGKKIDKSNSLKYNYNLLTLEWGENNTIKPEQVTYKSSKVVEWKCSTCENVWSTRIFNRTVIGTGCPVCSRKKKCKKTQ